MGKEFYKLKVDQSIYGIIYMFIYLKYTYLYSNGIYTGNM